MIEPQVLVLDLSSSTTGYVVGTTDGDPVRWGQFTVNKKGIKVADGAAYVNQVCAEVHNKTLEIVLGSNVGYLVYEKTDWHRSICGKRGKQCLSEYAIERRTQYALGQMAATMAVFQYIHNLVVEDTGANEVKKWLDAQRKDAVARWVAANWPDYFEFYGEKKGYFLTDLGTGALLSNHISDALSIYAYWVHKFRERSL